MLLCDFGKEIKMRLVDMGQSQKWLTEEVTKKTGLFFDGYYLHRILTGKSENQKIVNAIKEILGMEDK
jgi:hypothetical protein